MRALLAAGRYRNPRSSHGNYPSEAAEVRGGDSMSPEEADHERAYQDHKALQAARRARYARECEPLLRTEVET